MMLITECRGSSSELLVCQAAQRRKYLQRVKPWTVSASRRVKTGQIEK